MYLRIITAYAMLLCMSSIAIGDDLKSRGFDFTVSNTNNQKIVIDGVIDEGEWSHVAPLSSFINKWPVDSGLAMAQTEVKITYDANFLYLSGINYQKKEDVVIQTLKRDNPDGYWGSDGLALLLDPMNQQNNGFLFGVNAEGAQIEATLSVNGPQTNFDENWDNKWFSATKVYADYWVVEMAIPFTAIRFNESNDTWGINLVRNDMKNNVYSTWAQVPLAFRGIDLGHFGQLHWDTPPKKSNSNFTVIPYLAGVASKDYDASENRLNGSIGMDAKISLSSSLNLDLTVNPDFSNVDVDQQQTNLSTFSLFFPEKRGFFLENSDLFSNFGTWGVTPFFSRRIGLKDGAPVPILFGGRLSGNLTDKFRIGIMDVQTRATDDLAANNYFVTAAQYNVMKRSKFKLLATNRQGISQSETNDIDDYGRTLGGEFDYVSSNGFWTGSAKYHSNFAQDITENNSYYTTHVQYENGKVYGAASYSHVGENYTPDMGFVPSLYHYDVANDTTLRVGFNRINSWFGYIHRPKEGKVNSIEFNPWFTLTLDESGRELRSNKGLWNQLITKSNHVVNIVSYFTNIRLIVPSDLIGGDELLPARLYHNNFTTITWRSDSRKTISGTLSAASGKFYTGIRTQLSTTINIRKQPWGNFSLAYTQNRVDLGQAYGKTTLHLFGPQAEVSFTNKMFWTTFLQYNTQAENFNVNSRFQWRFKPMSDFFIVYAENYTAPSLDVKNRTLVLKLTYWLNL
ncbi:MAG: carbohydrate binding family 9 domain-containing protein [Cyclobacteriaceae bacterium]